MALEHSPNSYRIEGLHWDIILYCKVLKESVGTPYWYQRKVLGYHSLYMPSKDCAGTPNVCMV